LGIPVLARSQKPTWNLKACEITTVMAEVANAAAANANGEEGEQGNLGTPIDK